MSGRHAHAMGRREHRRRPAAADFHLLPSGAVAGRAGGAHAARSLRPHDRGDRAARSSAPRPRWRSASCAPRRRFATRAFPTRCPTPADLPERLDSVLRVVYLVFNEGYSGVVGRLADAARSLGRGDPPGTAAGRAAAGARGDRTAGADAAAGIAARRAHLAHGRDLILLDDQDRSLWNREQIAEGAALVERALSSRRFGPYTLQAAIAAVHAEAASADATDWARDRRAVRRSAARPSRRRWSS